METKSRNIRKNGINTFRILNMKQIKKVVGKNRKSGKKNCSRNYGTRTEGKEQTLV